MSAKTTSSKAKPAAAVETRESLDNQVEAFLKSGGEIKQIARGVSGQVWTSSRQITIGKKYHLRPAFSASRPTPTQLLALSSRSSSEFAALIARMGNIETLDPCIRSQMSRQGDHRGTAAPTMGNGDKAPLRRPPRLKLILIDPIAISNP